MLFTCVLAVFSFNFEQARGNGVSDLHVVVSGLRNNSGNVHIAIYDDPKKFPNPDGMILDIEANINERKARHSFPALEHKDYAIAVYHDMNNNNAFDQGFLGIPLEDFAFSNNAQVLLGPPSFSDASFYLSETLEISITID